MDYKDLGRAESNEPVKRRDIDAGVMTILSRDIALSLGQRAPKTCAFIAACAGAFLFVCAAAGETPSPLPNQPSPATASQPAPQAPNPPPAAAPDPNYKPGFADAFGRWIEDSFAAWRTGFNAAWGTFGGIGDQAGQAAKGAADAAANVAKGAADVATNVGRLPATRVVAGRERCATAPNGAPDCRIAAEAMCKAKGFASGNSIDFETSEKCPPPVFVSGRRTPEGVCTLENFVTRALCQ